MPHIGNFPPVGYPSPLAVPACAFLPHDDTVQFTIATERIQNRATLVGQLFEAPLWLPQGATITKVKLWAYRNDALATLLIRLYRTHKTGTHTNVLGAPNTLSADWTNGNGSIETTDFVEGLNIIDNVLYSYGVLTEISPNDNETDVKFYCADIFWQ